MRCGTVPSFVYGGDPSTVRVHLDASRGEAKIGGNGVHGSVRLLPQDKGQAPSDASISLDGANGHAVIGGSGTDGDLRVRTAGDNDVASIDATAAMVLGNDDSRARLVLHRDGTPSIEVDARNRRLVLRRNQQPTIELDAAARSIRTSNRDGARIFEADRLGNVHLGGDGQDGDLLLYASASLNPDTGDAAIHLDANNRRMRIRNGDGERIFELNAYGNLHVGGNDVDGDIFLYRSDDDGTDFTTAGVAIHADQHNIVLRNDRGRVVELGRHGNLRAGGNGFDGDVLLFAADADNTDDGNASIHLDADAGDITLRNADCAEDFEIADAAGVEPGMVMVIDGAGSLRPCEGAYDKRVAGVIAGAGETRPGIVLGRMPGRSRRLPISLVGRVWCFADADGAPIETGDLLTTSVTPGHAMKAIDRDEAFGAVLGKALAPLPAGCGLVPVLVALQ